MLEGRLDDFSLPDIFQLLALTRKTGTLRVRHGDTEGRVAFRDGKVVTATDDVRRTATATRMLAAGLIGESELEAALEATERGTVDGGVVAALVDAGAVDAETVTDFRRQQAEDAVFSLMRLSDATFHVDVGEPPSVPAEVELNTEQLVVEGGRRLSEWAEIRRRVPGRQSVPALTTDPPGEGPVTIGRDQWRLLALVDGRRRVGDLVDLLGVGEYAAVSELAGLVDAGIVSVADRASHTLGARNRGERLRELEARELGLVSDGPADGAASADVDPAPDDEADPAEDDATESARRPLSLRATLVHGVQLDDDGQRCEALAAPPAVDRQRPGPMPVPRPAHDPEEVGDVDLPAESEAAAEPESELAPEPAPESELAPEPAPEPELTFDPEPAAEADPAPVSERAEFTGGPQAARLTRDEDINKAMLLRLLDGVKGV